MRVLLVSSLQAAPDARGKLHALAGQGAELLLALPGGTAGLDGSIRLVPIPVSGDPGDPASLSWDARALRRAISDFRPDLVHIEEPPGTQGAAAAARAADRARIPYVVFSVESLSRRRGLLEARRYRKTLGHAAGLIAGNRLAERLLLESTGEVPATVIPQSGVAPAPPVARPARPTGLGIGFVGRLVPERGGETLLRACGQLLGAWTLTVVGTGPEQEPLEALAQRLGLASRIRWLGGVPRAELAAHWGEFDCLVIPSRDTPTWVERTSPVLLEAMARGIAPVVTPAGALPEMVGDAGVVVDDTEALALALQEMIADPERAPRIGARARQRVLDQFVDTAIAKRTLEFWREVLARVPRAAVQGAGGS